MSIEVLTNPSQLALIREEWNRLAKHPMSRYEWLAAWQQTFGVGHRLHTVVVRDLCGSVIGIAPWYEDNRWGVVTLRFLGSGKVCSDYAEILCDATRMDIVESELLDYLCRLSRKHSGWLFRGIDLEGVQRDSFQATGLLESLMKDEFQIRSQPQENCWQIHLPKTWEEYLRILGPSFRRRVKKFSERLDAGDFEVQHCRTSDQWSMARGIFFELHQARRASLGESGCLDHPPFQSFLDAAFPPLLDQGFAEARVLNYRNKPIAVALILKRDDYFGLYQTGICPSSIELEPGHTLNTHLIRDAIGRISTFDFMRGDEKYKASWRASPKPIERLTIIPANRLSRTSAQLESIARDLVHRLRHRGTDRQVHPTEGKEHAPMTKQPIPSAITAPPRNRVN